MICPVCSTENDAGSKFCSECGTPMNAGCPNCGATNKPGARFCNECGTALAGAAASSAPASATGATSSAAPVAERRLVTVLFADLVGFTPFAEERDAEEVRETLSRYFDLCSDIVGRYGGTIEKFIGDAVMAVWGAPVAHEDDAERAVRAALDLVEAVPRLANDVQARAGVLTGEAAVTIGAINQGLVAGDMVNTASRLQSAAPAGSVLVGESTMRASSTSIAYDAAGGLLLKGKSTPVASWRAVRVVAERGGRNRADALEAPFVGRADELHLLKDLFHATGRESKVRLVSVQGPAGIGKSRLAWEYLKYVDGLVETTYWHSGRSPAYGEGITFWALGEMVRSRCELLETDDEQITRRKVIDTVAQWVPDENERTWIAPALLALLGVESAAASDQLFAAWRTFFERIAARGTVTLLFEDAHFADTGTLDFIEHVLEWSRGFPIYIVTLARPELLERRPGWGAGKRSFTSIHLEPLPEVQMRELLAGLVPGLPESAVNTIVHRADGIPLYAVETVRMLVSDGRVAEKGGAYEPTGDLGTVAIPETLTALIASRLDSLEAIDRTLLQDASVLGQSFTPSALGAVGGIAEDELETRLSGLLRREFLTRESDPRSPERGQYVFMQALIREVAYNTIAKKDRKMRHLAAARYFESLGTDELAGALAGHYLAAQANAADGAEADALAAQARIALRGAGDRAANLGAHDQAIRFFEQALTVTSDAVEQADLLERAGESARTAARYEQAEALLRRAIEARRTVGDRVATARAVAKLGDALSDGVREEPALELLAAADAEFADLAPDPVVAQITVAYARALLQVNEFRRAYETAERVLEIAEPRNLMPEAARALICKGAALGATGRKVEGIALIEAAERISREHALNETLLAALIVGGFHKGDTDLQGANDSYREGVILARRLGHRGRMLALINNLGYTGFLTGDWDDALAEMEAALAEDLDPKDRISLLMNAAIIHAARGKPIDEMIAEGRSLGATFSGEGWNITVADPEGNRALAEERPVEARRAWQRLSELDPAQVPEFTYRSGVAALWDGDAAGAAADLAAIEATGIHGRVVEARFLTLRAGVAALQGRTTEAAKLFADGLAAWRDLRGVWDELLTSVTMVKLLDATDPDVRSVAISARERLAGLGATPFVRQLDAVLERQTTKAPAARTLSSSELPVETAG